MRIKADFRGIEALDRDLKLMRRRAIPHAIRDGLNDTAFAARKAWQANIQEEFTLRNTFTSRRVLVDKAQGTDLGRMRSVVGHTEPFLADRELGATQSSSGKHGVPIPLSTASGEGRKPGSQRKRPVRRPNRVGNINLGSRISRGTTKQKNAAAIGHAKSAGQRHVFLDLGRRKGLFRISGGKRRTKLDMLWDLSEKSVRVKPMPTLGPTVKAAQGFAPGIHRRALIRQFQRAGLPWK